MYRIVDAHQTRIRESLNCKWTGVIALLVGWICSISMVDPSSILLAQQPKRKKSPVKAKWIRVWVTRQRQSVNCKEH